MESTAIREAIMYATDIAEKDTHGRQVVRLDKLIIKLVELKRVEKVNILDAFNNGKVSPENMTAAKFYEQHYETV